MSNTSTTTTDHQKIWFAQVLRPVGCLLVIASHYFLLFVTAPEVVGSLALFPPVTGLPSPAYVEPAKYCDEQLHIGPGMFAVDLLFLVSGFVIPFSLRSSSLRGFFVRRFFRLYPTLWVALALILVLITIHSHVYNIPNPFCHWKIVLYNNLLLHSYSRMQAIEPVCWTLVVEELFYMVCALLAWKGALGRPAAILMVGAALTAFSLGWSAYRPGDPERTGFVGSDTLAMNCTHAIYIFVGVALHHLYMGNWRPRAGMSVVAALMVMFWLCTHHGRATPTSSAPGYFPAGVNALLVFVAAMFANRWLPYSRVVDRLANMSYPLYLIHATIGYTVIRAVFLPTANLYVSIGVAFTAILLLAAALHRWVEKPSMDLGRRLTRRQREIAVETQELPPTNRRAA